MENMEHERIWWIHNYHLFTNFRPPDILHKYLQTLLEVLFSRDFDSLWVFPSVNCLLHILLVDKKIFCLSSLLIKNLIVFPLRLNIC